MHLQLLDNFELYGREDTLRGIVPLLQHAVRTAENITNNAVRLVSMVIVIRHTYLIVLRDLLETDDVLNIDLYGKASNVVE
jgi:hypothetical protein